MQDARTMCQWCSIRYKNADRYMRMGEWEGGVGWVERGEKGENRQGIEKE